MTEHPRFDALVAAVDQAMIVVTAADEDERDGCLVGFHTQCSIHPARYLVLLSDKNRTTRLAGRTDVLGVHLLSVDQVAIARHFGELTGDDDVEKLAGVPWTEVDGAPVLDAPPAAFTGRIVDRRATGDHIAHVLAPLTVVRNEPTTPLRYGAVDDIDAGHPA